MSTANILIFLAQVFQLRPLQRLRLVFLSLWGTDYCGGRTAECLETQKIFQSGQQFHKIFVPWCWKLHRKHDWFNKCNLKVWSGMSVETFIVSSGSPRQWPLMSNCTFCPFTPFCKPHVIVHTELPLVQGSSKCKTSKCHGGTLQNVSLLSLKRTKCVRCYRSISEGHFKPSLEFLILLVKE